jgi:transcriptional antiterminator Rof (Rho-off)
MTAMDDKDAYQPVACAVYDAFEAAATRGRKLRLDVTGADGAHATVEARIQDLYAKEGGEYAVLDDGTSVRLDRLAIVPDETPPRSG